MTLVLGLRCRDGVVLAADSQRTDGNVRESVPKLFVSPSGILWGTAGTIATQQEMYVAMRSLSVRECPTREEGRDAVQAALTEAIRVTTSRMNDPSPAATAAGGVFAWYSAPEQRTFLLRVQHSGHAEFRPNFTMVGPALPQMLAHFALSRSEYLDYGSLPLQTAEMVAFGAADDVIREVASGLDRPVQVAVVREAGAHVRSSLEVRALEDTLGAFRAHQRDYLVRDEDSPSGPDTGVRP
ncbi:MAG: hypothetical protein QOG56_2492 [Solirubrobacteraceae bacterium]|jgi:hypothetical protein|nr:hypothetical protein [Solirubrobacteraceae bacterium]